MSVRVRVRVEIAGEKERKCYGKWEWEGGRNGREGGREGGRGGSEGARERGSEGASDTMRRLSLCIA